MTFFYMNIKHTEVQQVLADWAENIITTVKDTKGATLNGLGKEMNMDPRRLRGLARNLEKFRWRIDDLCNICNYFNIKPSTVLWNIENALESKTTPNLPLLDISKIKNLR